MGHGTALRISCIPVFLFFFLFLLHRSSRIRESSIYYTKIIVRIINAKISRLTAVEAVLVLQV